MATSAMLSSGATPAEAGRFMLQQCAARGLRPTRSLFQNVLAAHARHGKPRDVLQWGGRMRSAGIWFDRISLDTMLRAHAAVGAYPEAEEILAIFEQAYKEGQSHAAVAATVTAATAEAEPPLRSPVARHATATEAELPARSPASRSRLPEDDELAAELAATDGAAAADPTRDVRSDVIQCEGADDGLAHDPCHSSRTCHSSKAARCSARPPTAEEPRPPASSAVSERPGASRRGVQCSAVELSSSYQALLTARARSGSPSDAHALLRRMRAHGLSPDVVALNTVLSAYAASADARGAEACVEEFEKFGVRPDAVTFNTLAAACARARLPASAEAALGRCVRAGLAPSRAGFSAVMNAWGLEGELGKAEAVLQRMRAAGVTPDAVAYNTLMHAHARLGHAEAVSELRQAMAAAGVPPTANSASILLSALARSGRPANDLEAELHRMIDARAPLDAAAFNAVISAHAKAHQPLAAQRIFEQMADERVHPTLISFNALATAWASQGNLAATERVVAAAAAAGWAADRYTYGALLEACHRAANADAAATHVRAMLAGGIQLNAHLLSAARRAVGGSAAAFEALIARPAPRGGHGPTTRGREWPCGGDYRPCRADCRAEVRRGSRRGSSRERRVGPKC